MMNKSFFLINVKTLILCFFFFLSYRPKFTNDFQSNGNGKSNGNSFKESMKSRTHLGFGGDGKYR